MSDPGPVLGLLGVRPERVSVLSDVARENANWLVGTAAGERLVLRRYAAAVTEPQLAYEHAVLRYLAGAGWPVPEPLGEPARWQDRWYCLTRYLPGAGTRAEDPARQALRGHDLARLHLALRGLGERLGQRPGWQAQHQAVTTYAVSSWPQRVSGLAAVSPRLAAWTAAAAERSAADLAAVGADSLPLLVVHGDFAEWNVHYADGRLAGVVDFALTHLDSRPYELAIARAYRAPAFAAAYRDGLAAAGWPLSPLEEAAAGPVYRAFRVAMVVTGLVQGELDGRYDLAMIERQLARTGPPP